ncbi:MAG: hypothetical protein ACI9TV_000300 [Sulfurimonas sp.]|jgi:hypothetical protein|uniref:hypothetical protein n=1 Tax=Sulfurimonas sp. TaxID=2022749 RepID=UPI0039E2B375
MIQIKIFTQQSILVILLVSNAMSPLLALPQKSNQIIKRNQQVSNIFQKITNILVEKGLDHDVALQKTNTLLNINKNTIERLHSLYESSELFIPQEELVEELAKYALYEKKLNLNSYSSLIGLTQSILSRPLNDKELRHIQDIASL